MTVFAGDIIHASDINNASATIYAKAASLSRNTTVTYADDNELAAIPLAIGTYDIELLGYFTLSTTSTQKIKTNWAFTGSWNNPVRACFGPGSAQTADRANITEAQVGGYTCTGQDAIYDTSNSSGYSCFREICRTVTVTAAGNLSLQWAQSVSSGNNTTLQAGTCFSVRKIS